MTGPSAGPVGDLPDEIRQAALAAVHDAWPTDSAYIDDWHPDDQAMFRRQSWDSFAARSSAVLTERQQRVADAVASSVVPLIRAHIADQLDEFAEKATTNHEHWAYRHAARVARGGTTRLLAQRQAVFDLCDPEIERASSYSSFAKRIRAVLGADDDR